MSAKVPLLRQPENPHSWKNPHANTIHATQSLPFWKSRMGCYVHRVRSMKMHFYDGKYSHTSLRLWCGMGGFLDASGDLLEQPGEKSLVCATCEGRAIGTGLFGSSIILGRMVKFSPRL